MLSVEFDRLLGQNWSQAEEGARAKALGQSTQAEGCQSAENEAWVVGGLQRSGFAICSQKAVLGGLRGPGMR